LGAVAGDASKTAGCRRWGPGIAFLAVALCGSAASKADDQVRIIEQRTYDQQAERQQRRAAAEKEERQRYEEHQCYLDQQFDGRKLSGPCRAASEKEDRQRYEEHPCYGCSRSRLDEESPLEREQAKQKRQQDRRKEECQAADRNYARLEAQRTLDQQSIDRHELDGVQSVRERERIVNNQAAAHMEADKQRERRQAERREAELREASTSPRIHRSCE